MKKNTKILVVCLSSVLILGLLGTATGLIINHNKSSGSSTTQNDSLTSFYVDKSNINFTDDLLKFDVKAVALPSSLNLKIIWECENTTNIKLTYSESDSTKCTVECIAKFTDPLSMVCYPDGYKDTFSKNIVLTYNQDLASSYTLTLHYYKDGVEDTSLRSTKTIATGTEVFPSDYQSSLTGYTFQSSVPNDSFIMSADNSIQLNYVKNAPVSYTLILHYYKDGVEDTSLRSNKTIATGTEVYPSDYQSTLTGYTFQSSVPNDSFIMSADNSITYKYISNTPTSYSLLLYYYKDGVEDTSLRSTKTIATGSTVNPNTYLKTLSGFTFNSCSPSSSFSMNSSNSIQYYYSKNVVTTYSLTLHYYKNGSEDKSLKVVKSITKGTEVYPSDYEYGITGYTFQSSVPSDSFTMSADNSIQLNYVTDTTSSYSLTLHYYKDGVEDTSLKVVKSITKGTEVFPSDYQSTLTGYTFQSSVPNDSFDMNNNNSIQLNYVKS